MNAVTGTWIKVGELTDIPKQGARCIDAGDMTIAIFRGSNDEVFALEDKCPHKHGPLSQGIVHDGCVTCPLHNWVISLQTGAAEGADEGQVATYPARVEGGRILLDKSILTPRAAA